MVGVGDTIGVVLVGTITIELDVMVATDMENMEEVCDTKDELWITSELGIKDVLDVTSVTVELKMKSVVDEGIIMLLVVSTVDIN